jgi:hypothetical protein
MGAAKAFLLADHMDTDQFALASLTEDHTKGGAAFLQQRKRASAAADPWLPLRLLAGRRRCAPQLLPECL